MGLCSLGIVDALRSFHPLEFHNQIKTTSDTNQIPNFVHKESLLGIFLDSVRGCTVVGVLTSTNVTSVTGPTLPQYTSKCSLSCSLESATAVVIITQNNITCFHT